MFRGTCRRKGLAPLLSVPRPTSYSLFEAFVLWSYLTLTLKALESAGSFRSEFADILQATTGVVFLGAPLRGTRAANSAQWRILLAGIRGHEVSDTLLTDLNQNSTALRNLVQGFSTMAVKRELRLSITCFYETRKTEVLNSVLPRSLTQFLPKFTQEIVCFPESEFFLTNSQSSWVKNRLVLMAMIKSR